MKVQSMPQPIIGTQKETKVNAAGNFSNKSRTNGTAPSDQSGSVILSQSKVDSVILSQRSLDLSRAEKTSKTSNEGATQRKTEEKTENEKAVILGEKSLTPSRAENASKTEKKEEKVENEKSVIEIKKLQSERLAIDKSLKSKEIEIERIDRNFKQQSVNVLV